jgi:hypothetical protein
VSSCLSFLSCLSEGATVRPFKGDEEK